MPKRQGLQSTFTRSLFDRDVPDDWRLLAVGDVLLSTQYGLSEPGDSAGNTPIVGMRDINDGYVNLTDLATVDDHGADWTALRLRRGDILLNRTNSPDLVGKTGIVREDCSAVFASYLVRLTVNREKADPEYLNYWLNTTIAQTALKRLSTRGVSQANINPSEFRKHCPLPLPPLSEQRKIAAILRTWDEAIEKLKALQKAKERRARALAYTSLRRAGEGTAATTRPLSKLVRIVKGVQLNKIDIDDGEYPVWNGGITPSGFHNEWNTEGGTITISEGGNSCGFVNLDTQRFWLGGHCYALHDLSPEIDRDFLLHSLKTREAEIMRLRVGSGLPNIQRADLERFLVMVPPYEDQRKIARMLDMARKEITLIRAEIEALTRQKRGLMQKLLTGEWRVKTEAD